MQESEFKQCVVCDEQMELEESEEGSICSGCSSDRMFYDQPFETSTKKTRLWNKRVDKRLAREELFIAQKGCCAICGDSEEELKRSLNLDHDHDSMIIRGLLCSPCNRLIGFAKDNTHILRQAALYLEANGV